MLNFPKMATKFELTNSQQKVLSNICSNSVVLWLVAIFATNDTILLVRNILPSATFWYIAVRAEEGSKRYD